MKRVPLGLITGLAVTATAILTGCQKPNEPLPSNPASSHKYKPMTTLIARLPTLEPNTMSWSELGTGYDEQNTRYNKAKLFLSIGLTEVVKDPVIAEWMIAEAKRNEDDVFYFDELFAKFPETKDIIESTIDPLGKMTGWSFEQVQEQMQYEDFDIKASIYLTNTAIADASQKALVTPGYDIIGADEKHPSDVTLGFYINQQNEVSRINLWKEVVEGVAAPIFAIDGRATNKPPLVITGVPTYDKLVPMKSTYPWNKIEMVQIQIGQRYEKTSYSDYTITGKNLFFPFSGPGTVLQGYVNASPEDSRYFLRKYYCGSKRIERYEVQAISTSNVNSWTPVNTSQYFCWTGTSVNVNTVLYSERDDYWIVTPAGNVVFGPSRKKLYFNTYEDDGWFTSYKTLSPASINGLVLGLKGQMGQYNEWYQTDPYDIASWFPTNTFDANSIYTYANWEYYRWGPVSKGGWLKLKVTGNCQ